jgi:multiple sugar transport system ATP-binding protein
MNCIAASLGSAGRGAGLAQVRFQQVGKTYPPRRGGEPVEVLRSLDLTIEDGEFLVLVGPSGCGKSTLLRLLAGLETPTSGEILVGDRPVSRLRPAQRDVAMVFQSYALYPHLSVADNLSFGLRRSRPRTLPQHLQDAAHRLTHRWPTPLRVPSQREERIEARITAVAGILELESLLERLPKELSGGQKQRVALGRAIARQPAVFLMDEPLSNLDAKLRTGTRTQIVELQRRLGTTTLYVTHDQVEAMTMGHRIAVLNAGRLQQLGTPLELYQWPANLFVAQFIGSPPMNLLPVEICAPGQVMAAGRRFPVEGPMAEGLHGYVGRRLTGGLRPEHLRLAPAANRHLAAEVTHVESLGNEQLVTCRLLEGSDLLLVRATPEQAVHQGRTVHLEVDPRGWRLFDGDGLALSSSRCGPHGPPPVGGAVPVRSSGGGTTPHPGAGG